MFGGGEDRPVAGAAAEVAGEGFVGEAFKDAKPGSFKDVIVLVIGDAADKDKVSAVLQPTGATIRYVNW